MSMMLEGASTLVTGGGSGLGRATAEVFAREGARVAVADLNGDGAEETVQSIMNAGGEAYSVALDVTDDEALRAFIDGVADKWGRIDAAFNNAGISVEDYETPWGEEDLADKTIAVNYRSVLRCMVHELRHMEKAGKGSIVNTASIAGVSANGGAGYVASKHAVVGITRSAAVRYAAQGIRVNAVCPGVIDTAMTKPLLENNEVAQQLTNVAPMQRAGKPIEIAEVVAFLASDRASFLTAQPIIVDGGWMAY